MDSTQHNPIRVNRDFERLCCGQDVGQEGIELSRPEQMPSEEISRHLMTCRLFRHFLQ